MARYCIRRKNTGVTPPRFEFLRAKPTFIAAGQPAPAGLSDTVEGSVSAEDRIGGLRWTWRDPGDPSGWRNGHEPHDFGARRAAQWVAMIDGASLTRFGDDDTPPPAPDTDDAAARRAARRAYREALASGGEAL